MIQERSEKKGLFNFQATTNLTSLYLRYIYIYLHTYLLTQLHLRPRPHHLPLAHLILLPHMHPLLVHGTTQPVSVTQHLLDRWVGSWRAGDGQCSYFLTRGLPNSISLPVVRMAIAPKTPPSARTGAVDTHTHTNTEHTRTRSHTHTHDMHTQSGKKWFELQEEEVKRD